MPDPPPDSPADANTAVSTSMAARNAHVRAWQVSRRYRASSLWNTACHPFGHDPFPQGDDPVADRLHLVGVMVDHDDDRPAVPLRANRFQDHVAGLLVDAGRRLVKQKQPRAAEN